MKKELGLLLTIMVCFLGCHKENPTIDHIIFGSSACECAGKCITLYKLDDQHLYKMSNTVQGCMRPTDLNWTELPDSSFQKATALKQEMSGILKEKGGTVGCPDCVDQGTIIFEIYKTSSSIKWRLDPAEIRRNTAFSQPIKRISDVLGSLR